MRSLLLVVAALCAALAPCVVPARLPEGRPPLQAFAPDLDVYPQNFAIAVDDRARVYVGNADGVLIYDGADWRRVAVGNGDIVRSLAHDGAGRIYVGGYDAFGWIEETDTGRFLYRELSGRWSGDLDGVRFADIWHIAATPERVDFVALEHLFTWLPDSDTRRFVHHEGSFGPIARLGDRLLLQFRNDALREWREDRWQAVDGPDLSRAFLNAMVPLGDGTLVVVAADAPWQRWDGTTFTPVPDSESIPFKASATGAVAVDRDVIAMTTQLGRIVIHDFDTRRSEVLEVSPGFISGAVLAATGDLLAVDDLGFHALPWPAPWRRLDAGLAGTVHALLMHEGDAHVLTSSGAWRLRAGEQRFERLDWTDHEAWALLPVDDGSMLFADSYTITQLHPDGRAEVIDASTTAREFLRSPRNPDRVWVGTEFGLQVLERGDRGWTTVLRDDDMDALRVTQIVETGPDEVWIGSERGGIRRLRIEADTAAGTGPVVRSEYIGEDQGLTYGDAAAGAYLYRIDGKLVASTAAGIFVRRDGEFVADRFGGIAAHLPPGTPARLLVTDAGQWAYTHAMLAHRAGAGDDWTEVDLSGLLRGALNTVGVMDERLVIGHLGALLLHAPASTRPPSPLPPLRLSAATVLAADAPEGEDARSLALDSIRISSADTRLTLRFVLPDLDAPERVRYRTRLLPAEPTFSPWSDTNQQSFVSLPPGEFVYEVEARDGLGRVARLAVPVAVAPRWYQTRTARGAAALGALLALWLLASVYARGRTRRLGRERDRLEIMVEERTRELQSANEKLEHLAHLDGLTQIPNRRRLDTYLSEAWQQASERGRPMAVAMIDVDHFKRFNDSFGHQAGDVLLVDLAALLSRTLRRGEDLVARYGGEEFLVVLPGADATAARTVVEDMRATVRESGIGVTISAGVHCAVPDPLMPVAAFIAAADTALYRAKQAGRDRVVLATGEDAFAARTAPDAGGS